MSGTKGHYVDFHALSICGTLDTPGLKEVPVLLCLPRSHEFSAAQLERNKPGKRSQQKNRFAQELDPAWGEKEAWERPTRPGYFGPVSSGGQWWADGPAETIPESPLQPLHDPCGVPNPALAEAGIGAFCLSFAQSQLFLSRKSLSSYLTVRNFQPSLIN